MTFKDLTVSRSTIIEDITVFKPSVHWDKRGNIYTSYNSEIYRTHIPPGIDFVHDKFAESKHNVLRGLHGDGKTWKLISCVYGVIYEVVVDMRPDSSTYCKWDAFELNSNDYTQILVPPNFVNGYYVKSEKAVFHYKLAYSGPYIDAADQMTLSWSDERFGIVWPCSSPILQNRDKL